MELNIFMRELESALTARGIPAETAKKHVSNLQRTFTSDDLSEIEAIRSGSEIEQLADSISVILRKNTRNAVQSSRSESVPQSTQARQVNPQGSAAGARPMPERRQQSESPQRPRQVVPRQDVPRQDLPRQDLPQQSRPQKAQNVTQPPRRKLELPEEDDEYYSYEPGSDVTTRGMLTFWVGLFLTLPITLTLAVVLFSAFGALFAGLAGLIVGLIAVLVAVAACGAGVSLVGIVFGITQLFSFLSAGIYEIGLGIMVAGAVLLVSILLYNIAIRFLPWVIARLADLLGFVCGKLKNLFFVVRRECYKL